MYKIESKKDVRKLISSALQLLVLLALLAFTIGHLFTFSTYVPYRADDSKVVSGSDHGFVALSYFGVDRQDASSRISEERLEEQLKALYDLGYVTITQDDIERYYKEGKPLPDKALFLMFEDGRHDTSIYAQKIMEKYNFKATMFGYADKFTNKDSFFLMSQDLKKLENTSFWEIGSNGYRISYINVFDRYGRYLGELNSKQYSSMSGYLGRDYNHYLMDFIRDANDIPKETNAQMKARIQGEYELMKKEYNDGFGEVPKAYILLHSNTGSFGENDKVSAVNQEAIMSTFAMNFNREGYSLNVKDSNIYDLTRLEPQASWYTNHLLMRIRDDLPEADQAGITFVDGYAPEKENWETLKGAAEYDKDKELIVLTSLPEDTGALRLKKETPKEISFSARLLGNKLGCQSVFFGSDDELTKGIEVRLMNNVLYLIEDGEVLEEVDLYEFDGNPKISVEEDKRDSLAGEYSVFARYAVSHAQSTEYKKLSDAAANTSVRSVADGAEEYRPEMQISTRGNRKLDVTLKGNEITVKLDNESVWENHKLSQEPSGGLYLRGAWTEYGYSQRNASDDVYDAVFQSVEIKDPTTNEVLYSNRLKGFDKFLQAVKSFFTKLVNWFIDNI